MQCSICTKWSSELHSTKYWTTFLVDPSVHLAMPRRSEQMHESEGNIPEERRSSGGRPHKPIAMCRDPTCHREVGSITGGIIEPASSKRAWHETWNEVAPRIHGR